MISPTIADIGRSVCYLPPGKIAHRRVERGVVTAYNDRFVFVRYESQPDEATGQGTSREDLWWADDIVVWPDGSESLKHDLFNDIKEAPKPPAQGGKQER